MNVLNARTDILGSRGGRVPTIERQHDSIKTQQVSVDTPYLSRSKGVSNTKTLKRLDIAVPSLQRKLGKSSLSKSNSREKSLSIPSLRDLYSLNDDVSVPIDDYDSDGSIKQIAKVSDNDPDINGIQHMSAGRRQAIELSSDEALSDYDGEYYDEENCGEEYYAEEQAKYHAARPDKRRQGSTRTFMSDNASILDRRPRAIGKQASVRSNPSCRKKSSGLSVDVLNVSTASIFDEYPAIPSSRRKRPQRADSDEPEDSNRYKRRNQTSDGESSTTGAVNVMNVGPRGSANTGKHLTLRDAPLSKRIKDVIHHEDKKPRVQARHQSIEKNRAGPTECFMSRFKPRAQWLKANLGDMSAEEKTNKLRELWADKNHECSQCQWRREDENIRHDEIICFYFLEVPENTIRYFLPS